MDISTISSINEVENSVLEVEKIAPCGFHYANQTPVEIKPGNYSQLLLNQSSIYSLPNKTKYRGLYIEDKVNNQFTCLLCPHMAKKIMATKGENGETLLFGNFPTRVHFLSLSKSNR